jgi:hypothetical protein
MPDYISGIKKTGFILEHKITQVLKINGWSIINNKFYEDDLADTVREMDILAYKVSQIDDINLYTTLLFSCKKNEENAWALISRDIDLKDPNSNWWPLHIWTNDIPTNHELNSENINKEYYNFIFEDKGVTIMQPPEVDVFAFQELNKTNGKPQNDKNIFASLTTLMKAQSYEMGALGFRKNDKCIYHFNLISVIDSDLIRIHLIDDKIDQLNIETELLVARYIIKKKEQFFRIRFIKADSFAKYIESFNQLHDSNIDFFKILRNSFYNDAIKSYIKVNLLSNEFKNEIAKDIVIASGYELNNEIVKNSLFINWEEAKQYLRIFVTEDEVLCEKLRLNEKLISRTKDALLKIFHFSGKFNYETDPLPF